MKKTIILLAFSIMIQSCYKPAGWPVSGNSYVPRPCNPPSVTIQHRAADWGREHGFTAVYPDCQYIQLLKDTAYPYPVRDSSAFRVGVVQFLYDSLRQYMHYDSVEFAMVFNDDNVLIFYFPDKQ